MADKARWLGTATRKQSHQFLAERVPLRQPHAAGPLGSTRGRRHPAGWSRLGLDGAQELGKQRAKKWEDEQQIHLLAVYRAMVRLTT